MYCVTHTIALYYVYPLFGRLVFIVNGGYDYDKREFGVGSGGDMKITKAVDVFTTLFPPLDATASDAINAYGFGVKITTVGHQYFFTLSNATEIGSRHLMTGAQDNSLRLGFAIKRLFSF